MRPRSLKKSARGPTHEGLRAVVVGGNAPEAEHVSSCLARLRAGQILEFRHARDFLSSVPVGGIDLFVLAEEHSIATTNELLQWTRRNWPRCQIAVVCNSSKIQLEQVVRSYGGWFFIRPVLPEQWYGILEGVLQAWLKI